MGNRHGVRKLYVKMIQPILPAPSILLALAYFVPTVVEVLVFIKLWRRLPAMPEEQRKIYKANLLGYLGIVCSITGIVAMLIRWPSR